MALNFSEEPHRRLNILTGEWILVSPHRTKRPWQGKVETLNEEERPSYDPNCYLCPGNTRASGEQTEKYEQVYAFPNDFPALLPDTSNDDWSRGLLQAKGETGIARVICFSPNHAMTLPEMEVDDIANVIDLWQKEYRELGNRGGINHVQIFENKGEIMGCSNPHPHGQIWAQSSIPTEVLKKTERQKQYFEKTQRSMLEEYVEQELINEERILYASEYFVALVPFWAVWPYEAMILPKKQIRSLKELNAAQKADFAKVLKQLTVKYDNLFECSFPYSAGIHQAPTDGQDHEYWHFHMSFYPPLLRSATVKKFMVGYEMFANPQRDITAEQAAEKLRSLSDVHYKQRELVLS